MLGKYLYVLSTYMGRASLFSTYGFSSGCSTWLYYKGGSSNRFCHIFFNFFAIMFLFWYWIAIIIVRIKRKKNGLWETICITSNKIFKFGVVYSLNLCLFHSDAFNSSIYWLFNKIVGTFWRYWGSLKGRMHWLVQRICFNAI